MARLSSADRYLGVEVIKSPKKSEYSLTFVTLSIFVKVLTINLGSAGRNIANISIITH